MRGGRFIRTTGALAVVAGLAFGLLPDAVAPDKRLNNLARFCAGLDVDRQSEFYDLALTDDWAKFAAGESARWESFKTPADKIRSWVRAEVSRHKTPNPAEFYPFGGPDILFAGLMRPSARLYVLVGLEPVGSAPHPIGLTQFHGINAYSRQLDDQLVTVLGEVPPAALRQIAQSVARR
jgi:hypothetical protein